LVRFDGTIYDELAHSATETLGYNRDTERPRN
jgi:hypothetical protein